MMAEITVVVVGILGALGLYGWRNWRKMKRQAQMEQLLLEAVAEQRRKEEHRGLHYDLNQRIIATTQRLQRTQLELPTDLQARLRRLFQ